MEEIKATSSKDEIVINRIPQRCIIENQSRVGHSFSFGGKTVYFVSNNTGYSFFLVECHSNTEHLLSLKSQNFALFNYLLVQTGMPST